MRTIFLLFVVVYIKMTNSQYYAPPASSYQPYNYYYSPTPTTPPIPQTYATPTYAATPSYAPTPGYPGFPPTYTKPPIIASPPATYARSPPPAFPPSFPPPPAYPQKYAPPYPSPITPPGPVLKYLTPASKPSYATVGSPKCHPATATVYYLTTVPETPKAAIQEKVKDIKEAPAPPAYYCPFCTGFANVPKNPKVPPPPSSSPVLPGILDKIPTIAIPDELKMKDLRKLTPPPTVLSDLLEHKLSGKMRFDEDLLDGFLTGLGLTKCKN